MGTVTTDRTITAEWTIENHGAPGTFGILSRDATQSIYVDVQFLPRKPGGAEGAETVELVHIGDSCSWDLADVSSIRVRAGTGYPTHALVNFTNLPIELSSAPFAAGGDPAHPVYVSGALSLARFAGANDQTGAAPGAANTGAALMFSRVVQAGDPATWAAVGRAGVTFGEAELILVEYPASGGVPTRIGAGALITNQPSAAGSATGPIPDVLTTGADLDVIAFFDDPDYHPAPPAGFTEDQYLPRPGAARLSGAVAHKSPPGGTGLAFAGGGTGAETQWHTSRATFAHATGPKVQSATGFSAPGAVAVLATLPSAPTPGNLLLGWVTSGQAGSLAPTFADIIPVGP